MSVKLLRTELLIAHGRFAASDEWDELQAELADAIGSVVWPPGAEKFTIYPQSGRKRGEGNGVKPIKDACMLALKDRYSWELEKRVTLGRDLKVGKFDALRQTRSGLFVVEWETGNISSSHRSLNKMVLGLIQGALIGGALIVPSRGLYKYLTDRVGNVQELEPYYPFWSHAIVSEGLLAVIVVEHDATSTQVPRISKGTDGRALL